MSDPAFSGIPEALATAVRAVDVPHDLRTLFERLAVPLALEVEAPVEDAPPLALQRKLHSRGVTMVILPMKV